MGCWDLGVVSFSSTCSFEVEFYVVLELLGFVGFLAKSHLSSVENWNGKFSELERGWKEFFVEMGGLFSLLDGRSRCLGIAAEFLCT